jgi:hypothetical protein
MPNHAGIKLCSWLLSLAKPVAAGFEKVFEKKK